MALTASSQSGSRSTIILVVVIGLHLLVFWGIQNGLARKVVQLLPPDIQTKIIKEDKKDEPPPPPPPPPDIQTPPPFVPPPEVSVQTAVATNAIQTVTTERPPVVAAPVMAPAPVAKEVIVPPTVDRITADLEQFYPANAKREGREGSVVVAVYVDAKGKITDIKVDESSGSPDLDEGAVKYARTWKFKPGTRNGVPEALVRKTKITFKIKTS